jgi:uncharacterized RDD family membrane protein YckC
MKCPKCSYLGFETGDRCKNCGYDFSLLMDSTAAPDRSAMASAKAEPDLPLREADAVRAGQNWLDLIGGAPEPASASAVIVSAPDPLAPLPLDTIVAAPPPARVERVSASLVASGGGAPVTAAPSGTTPPGGPAVVEPPRAATRTVAPPLPLFHPALPDDDQPLIKVPAAPRRPLSVRRTPPKPRSKAVSPLEVPLDAAHPADEAFSAVPSLDDPLAAVPLLGREERVAAVETTPDVDESTGPGRRLAAAAVDHAILLAIDLVVVYFTLRMAGLTIAEWSWLPPVPLIAFLAMMKAAYFYTFTLLGGQTIGKMAMQIRVVTDEHAELDAPRAIQRTLVGMVSLLVFGLGLAPLLFSSDRRALHDHVARTKVVKS